MFHLTIVGAGIKEIDQLSLEGLRALQVSHHVLSLGIALENLAKLPQEVRQKVQIIDDAYRNGALDWDNYVRIAAQVSASVQKHGRVCFLIPGHPRFAVSFASVLEALGRERGYPVEILPGVSSFDTMVNDLALDPLERGTVVVDANRLVRQGLHIDPRLDAFIYHVSSVLNDRTDFENPAPGNRIESLVEALRRFRDGRTSVAVVSSGMSDTEPLGVEWMTLDDLAKAHACLHFATSLYLPASTACVTSSLATPHTQESAC
jgi:uncharacterized protein YabN with tetrapyrrole methylase and pyrophosphatase domain